MASSIVRACAPLLVAGLIPLSYQVADANIVALRERYMGYILAQQKTNENASSGWLGQPVHNPRGPRRS